MSVGNVLDHVFGPLQKRVCFLDMYFPVLKGCPLKTVYCPIGIHFQRHVDDSVTTQPPGEQVVLDFYGLDLADLGKYAFQVVLRDVGRQVLHADLHRSFSPLIHMN